MLKKLALSLVCILVMLRPGVAITAAPQPEIDHVEEALLPSGEVELIIVMTDGARLIFDEWLSQASEESPADDAPSAVRNEQHPLLGVVAILIFAAVVWFFYRIPLGSGHRTRGFDMDRYRRVAAERAREEEL